MFERTQHTGFGLDPACPVEWFHPLSKGLLAKWLVPPNAGWRGGSTVRDLVRGGRYPNDGTFANVTPAAAWKGARGRIGGYGSILLDGSNQQVDCGTNSTLCLTAAMTVACWVKTDGGGRGGELFVANATSGASANWGLGYDIGGDKKLNWWHGGGNRLTGTAALDTGWHHIVTTRTGSTFAWTVIYYIDGVLDTSGLVNSADPNGGTNLTTAIGTLGAYNSYYQYGGYIDDVSVWGRALSAVQVAALYAESRRGYPDALRWCSTVLWSLPGTDTSVPTGVTVVTGIGKVLDSTCPVAWDHSLNRGLVGKWMVPPNSGWRGGSTLRDLVRGARSPNDGTLSGSPTWQGASRPGGNGALLFDGSAMKVDCGKPSVLSLTSTGSVFAWIKATADPNSNSGSIVDYYDNAVSGNGYSMYWNFDADQIRCEINNGGAHGVGNGTTITFGANDFAWHHVGFTWDGANIVTYKDGLQNATTAQTINAGTQTRNAFMIGAYGDASTKSFKGYIDDVSVWNRALSAVQVRALLNQSRRGYPDALRWLPTRTWFVPPVAVTGIQFDAASNSGYQAAQSTYSWSHTCTGTNRYLAVDISLLSVPGTVVLSLTYAGVEMDPLGARSTVSGAGRVECWGLTNPATGTNTISVTLSASVASSGTAASYTGVNQQEPTEGFASSQATNVGAADATVNVTTVADNDWVHAALATDDTSVTANQTSRNNVSGALGSGADEDTGPKTPAGSVTMSYTGVGALATWVIAAYAIRPTTAPIEDVIASWYTLRTVVEEEIEVLTN